MCKVPKGKDRFGANEDNKRKSMRHRKEAINWIAVKSEPSHRTLWAKLCLLVFIPGVRGSHGKFVSRAVDSDKIQFTVYEAHSD